MRRLMRATANVARSPRGWIAVCAFALVLGCGSRPRQRSAGPQQGGVARTTTERVVSTVDRNPITLREVEELVLAGLPPAEALRRLQAQSLLTAEAERRALGELPAVQRTGAQAAVQALLQAEAGAVEVTEAELRQAYAEQRARFELPERRLAAHVLARPLPQAPAGTDARAKEFAAAAIEAWRGATDVDAFLQRQKSVSLPGIEVVAERLPELVKGQVPGLFGDALFGLASEGVVESPVQTRQGWHAVRVLRILPPEGGQSFAQASEVLRPELLLRKQTQHIEQLVERLRLQYRVSMAADVRESLAALPTEATGEAGH